MPRLRKVRGIIVLKSHIKTKPEYPLRERRTPGTPVQWMRVINSVRRNKRKAAWIVLRIRTTPLARNRYQGDGITAATGVESPL
jgi:hypothetical protein